MYLYATPLLVLLLTILTSAAPIVESEEPLSTQTASNSPISDQSQPSTDVVLPTVHDRTQQPLKLNDADFPVIHNKQKPAESSLPLGYKKRDIPDQILPSSDDSGLPFIYNAQLSVNSAFPYGLNQDTPPS